MADPKSTEGTSSALPLIDEYELLRPIGRGAMGTVWLALDRNLDRMVAIKMIAESTLDERSQAWLVQEARALGKLRHPNVVHVYRVGNAQDKRPPGPC